MRQILKRPIAALMAIGVLLPILAACGQQPAQVIRETVPPVVVTAPPQVQTVVVPGPTAPAAAPVAGAEAFTTPHPILSDLNVRQAMAHCTNRPELIKSVYPFLDEQQQQALLMDTFIPSNHWAHTSQGITTYPFDAAKGQQMLESAGWKLAEGGTVREKDGQRMSISFTTTNAQFRQTWSQVWIQQMAACGIEIIPTYAPGSWWFGSTTGLRRRDFELGAFAWVGAADPGGQTLYSCEQIPLPSNNWEGQNYMGWCNETASKAIVAANNTLTREDRKEQYAIAQREFTKDMVSLPLFNRAEAVAWSTNLKNFKANPTDYYTVNADQWELTRGDTAVLAFTQEPATMNSLTESAAVQATAQALISAVAFTSYDYEFQPVGLKELPTLENGGAKNEEVEVKAGDMVWTTAGEPVELAAGVEVVNAAGETVAWDGSSPLKLKQLTVTYEFQPGIKWSDGEPVKKADFELGYKHSCDKESGATSYTSCESIGKIDFTNDTAYTVTYLPGSQGPLYFLPPFSPHPTQYNYAIYPSHLTIETEGPYKGKKLADVPAKDWATLKEIAESPLSTGPYVLAQWDKGQKMVFEANPNYYKEAPKVKNITILFVADTNQAVAQLLTGDVDVVGSETLGAGPEVETVLNASKEGKVNAEILTSATWEHIDFNLFTK